MDGYLMVIGWSLIGSILSLIGGVLLLSFTKWRRPVIDVAMPFGAGAMLSAAFLGMIPEALHDSETVSIMLFVMGGFLVFFLLERLLGWFHHHEQHHHDGVHGKRDATHRSLVVIGDTLHNAIDGVAIGVSFLVSPTVGVGTALAVALHEVPQEIGDFGILLGKGMKPRKVLLVNVLSSLVAVLTAVGAYALGSRFQIDPAPLLAIAAGMFIYVAASDLIPDIHEQPRRKGSLQAVMLFVGVIVIGLVVLSKPHDHDVSTLRMDEIASLDRL